ncbi:MAG: hypothetical protein AAB855_02320 [Patescibacteria group bacterium]
MAETLKKLFNADGERRVLLHHSSDKDGGIGHLMPSEANVGLYTEAGYVPEDLLNHAYYDYIFGVLGRPASIETIHDVEKGAIVYHGAPIVAESYSGPLAKVAREFGSSVTEEAQQLNNKLFFQTFVTEALGAEYSTKPTTIEQGTKLSDLLDAAQMLLDAARTKSDSDRIVVRVPDTAIAPGMGIGVLFATNQGDITSFLTRLSLINEHQVVTTDILLERFIPHIYSPSITYFIADEGAERLSVNAQILDGSRFVASTNILPKEIEGIKGRMEELGDVLADKAQQLGARGFIGFDTVITPDQRVVFIESNYRETGTTVPYTVAQRAVNFVEHPDDIGWAYVIENAYTKELSNVELLLEALRSQGHLFEGAHRDVVGLDRPRAVVTYAGGDEGYDIAFFWGKHKIEPEKAFEEISKTLQNIDVNVKLTRPTITYAK